MPAKDRMSENSVPKIIDGDGERETSRKQDAETECSCEAVTHIPAKFLTPEDLACKREAENAMEIAVSLLHTGNWTPEKTVGGDVLQSMRSNTYGKTFYLVGNVNLSASEMFNELIHNCENNHWNLTVKKVKRLQIIDDCSDVVYVLSSEGAGGLVSSRDLVNVRTWNKKGNSYVLGLISTLHHKIPLQRGIVRGEQGPSVYVITPCAEDSLSSQVQWVLNLSLKGWIPQYILDKALPGVMFDYMTSMRTFASSKRRPT